MAKISEPSYILRDTDLLMADPKAAPYVLRVRDLPAQEKPREKLIQLGPGVLSVSELVAVLLNVGTRKEDVLSMAQRILKEYGETAIMHETNPTRLAEVLDIPIGKACQVVVCFEIGRRYFAQDAGKATCIRNARQAYSYMKDMSGSQKEQLRGLYLNSRHEVVYDEIISIGTMTANIVHPREVFQPALAHGAVAIIVAHNHPSGNAEPTTADIEVTEQLIEAGKVLGIDLLDHLVITKKTFVSIIEKL